MVKFDSDGSGSISFEEFVDKLLLLPEVSPKAVFESWHRMVVDDAQVTLPPHRSMSSPIPCSLFGAWTIKLTFDDIRYLSLHRHTCCDLIYQV